MFALPQIQKLRISARTHRLVVACRRISNALMPMSEPLGLYGSGVSDQKAYACTHCLEGKRPVLYVVRESGDLMLTCGGEDHAQSADDLKVVHLGHLIGQDATLDSLPELIDGYEAERGSQGELWRTRPIVD